MNNNILQHVSTSYELLTKKKKKLAMNQINPKLAAFLFLFFVQICLQHMYVWPICLISFPANMFIKKVFDVSLGSQLTRISKTPGVRHQQSLNTIL